MKRSLEKWGRAPIILRVLVEHLLFLGVLDEHQFSRRARALTIQRQTSKEQVSNCKVDMKEMSS